MVRGGAFNNNQRNARATYRNRNDPDNRNDNNGFRVVVSTFFFGRKILPAREGLQVEAKNGGVCSWPRPDLTDRANSNRPAPWVPALARGSVSAL